MQTPGETPDEKQLRLLPFGLLGTEEFVPRDAFLEAPGDDSPRRTLRCQAGGPAVPATRNLPPERPKTPLGKAPRGWRATRGREGSGRPWPPTSPLFPRLSRLCSELWSGIKFLSLVIMGIDVHRPPMARDVSKGIQP